MEEDWGKVRLPPVTYEERENYQPEEVFTLILEFENYNSMNDIYN